MVILPKDRGEIIAKGGKIGQPELVGPGGYAWH